MYKYFYALLIFSVSFITGCSNTPNGMSWQEIGYQSGISGHSKSLPEGTEAREQYLLGYQEGITKYCNFDGFGLGVTGSLYFDVCDDINSNFTRDYRLGYMTFQSIRFSSGSDRIDSSR